MVESHLHGGAQKFTPGKDDAAGAGVRQKHYRCLHRLGRIAGGAGHAGRARSSAAATQRDWACNRVVYILVTRSVHLLPLGLRGRAREQHDDRGPGPAPGTGGVHGSTAEGRCGSRARRRRPARAQWQLGRFADADAWWLDGSRTLLLPNEHLRVQPAVPSGRSVQLALADVDRPVAFTLPLAAAGFQPAVTFDLADAPAGVARAAPVRRLAADRCWRSSRWLPASPSTSRRWLRLLGSAARQRPAGRGGPEAGRRRAARAPRRPISRDASWCIRDHGARRHPAELLARQRVAADVAVRAAHRSATCCRRTTAASRCTSAARRGCRSGSCATRTCC